MTSSRLLSYLDFSLKSCEGLYLFILCCFVIYTDNAFMLNVTIRNGKINGELNGDNGELNGELNPALLYLNKSELAVYHLIEKAPQNSRQEIADQLGISTRTVDRAIKALIQKDLIMREGSKKTGHWKIK